MFSELTGEQIFMLEKEDFEKYCGNQEGTHLDSQIKVQKSLCGVTILFLLTNSTLNNYFIKFKVY